MLMLLSKVKVTFVPFAEAVLLNTIVQIPETKDDDTIVVPVCMPVPDTDTPAPMATFVEAKVTFAEPEVMVLATAVKTPTGLTVVPVKAPSNGRVLT